MALFITWLQIYIFLCWLFLCIACLRLFDLGEPMFTQWLMSGHFAVLTFMKDLICYLPIIFLTVNNLVKQHALVLRFCLLSQLVSFGVWVVMNWNFFLLEQQSDYPVSFSGDIKTDWWKSYTYSVSRFKTNTATSVILEWTRARFSESFLVHLAHWL